MIVILNEVKNLGLTVFRAIQTKILHFVQNDNRTISDYIKDYSINPRLRSSGSREGAFPRKRS